MPTFTGTDNGETLTGTSGDDELFGLGGNDILIGAGGNDTSDGGDGNDQHQVDSAGDIVIERSGEGDDEVITSVSYVLTQSSWVETLRTSNAASTAALSLWGNEIAQSIYGNAGNNVLGGGAGNDFLVGLEGNDYLIGGAGSDVMMGGTGDDAYTIDLQVGDVVRYEGEQFPLSATILDVGDGDTVTVRIQRSSTVFETRTVSISTLFGVDTILEDAGEGNDVVLTQTSYALGGASIEVVVAADGTADIMLRGNSLNNSLYGNDGDNLLTGGGGDDYLFGGGGADRLFGDTGDDTLVGGDGNDELRGGSGRDTLFGGNGDDLLDATSGSNGVMVGGSGNDTYVVSAGTQVVEAAGEGFDRIDLNTGTYTLAGGVSVEVIAAPNFSFASYTLTGNELDQTIVGSEGFDRLAGGGGTDTLNGRGGNDIYDVYDGREIIVEAANQGNDTVFTSIDYTLNAGAQVETISTYWQFGTAGLDITGNEFTQTIVGDFGSNMLDGKGGSDTLVGLGGADIFAFTTALGSGNIDRINDFQSGIDTIALDDAIFTGLVPGNLPAGAFATGTAATEADDRIIYDPATGKLYFDADGVGGAAAVQFATLDNMAALQASDFLVV